MLPIIFSILLASLLTMVSSSPSFSPRQVSLRQQYYLRTSIVDSTKDTGTPKDNLYVTSYHTGAGLSDVTLTPNISYALSGYLNTTANPNSPTTWITNLTSIPAGNQTLYWGMCDNEIPYGKWEPMTINLGQNGCDGFYTDGDLLIFGEHGGWLACDWWHEIPQLFFITFGQADSQPFSAPTSCSLVDLQMLPVDEDGNVC